MNNQLIIYSSINNYIKFNDIILLSKISSLMIIHIYNNIIQYMLLYINDYQYI